MPEPKRGGGACARRRTPAFVAAIVGLAACTTLLPEGYAIRGPIWNSLFGWGAAAPPAEVFARRVHVPDGLGVSIFAEELPNARMLRFTPAGELLVSQPRKGRIAILERDRDGDGRADGVRILVDGLNRPHGMDFHDGWLYVAEGDAVARMRFDAAAGRVEAAVERVVTGLPSGGNHWTRTLRFGPDGWMYVTVGSSCNACLEDDPRRGAMLRFRSDGTEGEIFATGLRNSVDFDWHPDTGKLYATDNGRDFLGDDFPPCELNRVVDGGFYGWPFANGERVPDPDHGAGREREIAESIPPVHDFAPHTAPLGIGFLRHERWPKVYRGAALVALHGSWNRTRLVGYRVVSLHWRRDGTIGERDFLWGLEDDGHVIGRPVAVAEGPDGAAYVSDDYAGVIYRVAPSEPSRVDPHRGAAWRRRESAKPDVAAVARGRRIWEAEDCASCHDPESALPGIAVRPLRALSKRYSIEELVAFLAAPAPPMPPFEGSDSERRDLAAYLLDAYR